MIDIKCFHPKEPYGSNCYLISSQGEYAVIDPSVSYDQLCDQFDITQEKLKYVIVTHAHFDHILEIDSWADKCQEILVGGADKLSLSDPHKNCYSVFFGVNKGYYGEARAIFDKDIINLGGEELNVIAAPGHTPGGIALKCQDIVFSGDTIFAQGYGRYDLPGGDPKVLFNTIKLLLELPDDTTVYSGHGGPSTIGKIKEYLNF